MFESASQKSGLHFRLLRGARRIPSAIFWGTFCSVLACAAFPSSHLFCASRWLKLKSANFELLTSAGENQGRDLISQFEQVRRFFLTSMGPAEVPSTPVRIIGFGSVKEFNLYRPSEFAAAFYAGGSNGDYIVMKGTSAEYYPVAIHEYVHLLLRHSGLHAPPWWQEGFADLYSTLRVVGDKYEVGAIHARHYDILRRQSLLDLATLISSSRYSPLYNNPDKAELFYAESWALVHMLYLSNGYRPRFDDFMRLLAAGTDPAELFSKIYGKTLSQVGEDLRAYLDGGSFNIMRYPVSAERYSDALEDTPATDLEVQTSLANVCLGVGRSSQAYQILEQLGQTYPKSWEVEEALGYVYWYGANRQEARAHFARAVEKGMTNANTYLDYVALLSETGVSTSTLVALVERALQLQPENRQANLGLASLELSEGKFEQVIERVAKIPAARTDEAFQSHCLLAYAYLGLGEIDKAEKSAADARPNARTPAEVSEVESLFRSLTEWQEGDGQRNHESVSQLFQITRTSPIEDTLKSKSTPEVVPAQTTPTPQARQDKNLVKQIDSLAKRLRRVIETAGKRLASLIGSVAHVFVKGKSGGKFES